MISLVTKKEVCSVNFINPIPKLDYSEIKDENGNVPYRVGQTYLKDRVKLLSIETKIISGNPFLIIGLGKLEDNASSKTITRSIPLLVDLDSATSPTAIVDCFSLNSSIAETVKYEVAKRICENTYGVGTVKFDQMFDDSDPLNPTCGFDGFATGLNLTCPDGESVRKISYNAATMTMEPECSIAFSPTSVTCDNNWIKRVNADGTFVCAELSQHVDTQEVAFNAGDICKLELDNTTNKVKLSCSQIATDGVCDYSDEYLCSPGISTAQNQTSTNYTWTCTGLAGGNSSSCSMPVPSSPTPVNGVCDNSTAYGCNPGTAASQNESSTLYTWSCLGSDGGSTASFCSKSKAVACTYPNPVSSISDCSAACPGGPTKICQIGNSSNSLINCPSGNNCFCTANSTCPGSLTPVGPCSAPTCSGGLVPAQCGNEPGSPPTTGSIYHCDQGTGLHWWCKDNSSSIPSGADACIEGL
jgi:hypothetical protein